METLWWLLPLVLALVIGGLCPLAGTLLLVQRRLFLANLVSHAVLPGLALALALRLDPGLGGVISGLAGALLAERLSRGDRSGEGGDEAVLNTVLAGFLGLGVLLIPLLHIRVDLEAVLFGDLLAAAPADLLRSLLALVAVLLLLAWRYHHYVYLGVDPLGASGPSGFGWSRQPAPSPLALSPGGYGDQRWRLSVGDPASCEPAARSLDRGAVHGPAAPGLPAAPAPISQRVATGPGAPAWPGVAGSGCCHPPAPAWRGCLSAG